MDEKLNRIEDKLDKLDSKFDCKLTEVDKHLSSIDKTLAVQSQILDEHQKRTKLSEERISNLEKFKYMTDGIFKVLAWLMGLSGVAYSVVKVLEYIKK